MKIAVYGTRFEATFTTYINELLQRLVSEQVDLHVFEPFYRFLLDTGCPRFSCSLFSNALEAPDGIDFLISVGGDGTFLSSMLYLKSSDIPVIGLNSGRLGFLANIGKEEINKAFDAIFKGDYKTEQRTLLRVETDIKLLDGYNFALNEVTVQKIDSALISVDAWLNDEFLNTYWTDGLIIATPTGSTAYSMSVGGPIVVPGSDNFILAPIASHNLTVRPIVVPDNVQIKLEVKSRSNSFLVTADNRKQQLKSENNVIYIRKSKFELKMLKLPFNNYYATLQNKLMWGMDKRN